jgi:hypothetical protein
MGPPALLIVGSGCLKDQIVRAGEGSLLLKNRDNADNRGGQVDSWNLVSVIFDFGVHALDILDLQEASACFHVKPLIKVNLPNIHCQLDIEVLAYVQKKRVEMDLTQNIPLDSHLVLLTSVLGYEIPKVLGTTLELVLREDLNQIVEDIFLYIFSGVAGLVIICKEGQSVFAK